MGSLSLPAVIRLTADFRVHRNTARYYYEKQAFSSLFFKKLKYSTNENNKAAT